MLLRLTLCYLLLLTPLVLGITELRSTHHDQLHQEREAKAHAADETHGQYHVLQNDLNERASLFFRRMDFNHDKHISPQDVAHVGAESALATHFPGVSNKEFVQFIEIADQNGDHKLSKEEFLAGLGEGISHMELLEMNAAIKASAGDQEHRVGFLQAVKNFISSKLNPNSAMTLNDGCVICQYILERVETNIKNADVFAHPQNQMPPFTSFLEVESKDQTTSLLEVDNSATDKQEDPHAAGHARQSTRYQRQLERQKFNEIYRIADITLDDVCEQGMPNTFYGFCKTIYQSQSDIVDGLRYQYRPADICFKIGMCSQSSYITVGIHSRYRVLGTAEGESHDHSK